MSNVPPERGWGPDGSVAAISITFDNMGEALDLEIGRHGDKPIGQHHTATFLPKLIEVLDGVKATYFMEGSNAAIYPQAIRGWAHAGHEVAIHAWRHEVWSICPADRRRDLLAKSVRAFRGLDIEPVGFRPPGGIIPQEAWDELAEAGLLYCSEAGKPGITQVGSVISLPFEWEAVDAYVIEDDLTYLRQEHGFAGPPASIAHWRAELERIVDEAVSDRGHRAIVFHPDYVGRAPDKLDQVSHVIQYARSKGLWIAPMAEVAAFAKTLLCEPQAL